MAKAEGKLDLLPDLAAELVHRKVDIIVSAGPAATRPLKEATKTIPIVMTQDTDPVGNAENNASFATIQSHRYDLTKFDD